MRFEANPSHIVISILAFLFIATASASAGGPTVPHGFFFEDPLAITGVKANVEVINLDDSVDGVLIQNSYRVDIGLLNNTIGIYAKFPFAGVTSFGPADEDEYNFGNIGIGGKLVLLNLEHAILTTGFEVIIPTSSQGFGSTAAQLYFRDAPYFLKDATTLVPFAVIAIGGDAFALQGNFAAEIITDAEEIEGDNTELRLKYGGTGSITPPLNLPFTTSLMVEVMVISTTSFADNVTEVFITPGLRIGGQIMSVGAGVQIPAGEKVDNFADENFFFDLIINFGS